MGTQQKIGHFKTASNTKQNVKKVWERRSHAFPPHYAPDCVNKLRRNLGLELET